MERQTFTLGPLGGLRSKKPVKCSVCQTDKGTFFSTGNDVHACRKVGYISVFFETGRILGVSILQNSSDPTPPFFERISGGPEKGAVWRVPVTVFWGSSGNTPFLTSKNPKVSSLPPGVITYRTLEKTNPDTSGIPIQSGPVQSPVIRLFPHLPVI